MAEAGGNGGEAGIRTLGPARANGFQDRRFRPLSHLSDGEKAYRKACVAGNLLPFAGDSGIKNQPTGTLWYAPVTDPDLTVP